MADPTAEAFSDVIDALYQAAHEPQQWTQAMEAVRILFDGSRSCLLLIDAASGYRSVPSVADDWEFDSGNAFELAVSDDLHDAWLNLEVGRPTRYCEMMDLKAFRERDLSRLFFRPRDMDNGLVSIFKSGPLTHWSLDISRSRKQEEFSDRHVALSRRLLPHVLRAREISTALNPRITPRWPDFTHAYFVVDARGRTIEMNAAAEALLSRADSPLRQVAGSLRAARAEDVVRLGGLIASSCTAPEDPRSTPGGMMIAAASEDAPVESRLLLSVSPMPNGGAPVQQRRAIVLARSLQASAQSVLADMSAELFGLSASQARLAAVLASGLSLQDAATQLGLSYGTVRSYLEIIFRRTATNRQPELVALLKTIEATRATQLY